MVLVGLDELPMGYAQYASTTQVLLSIFVAAQAPVLFSRDLRTGAISLYFARPLRRAPTPSRAGPRSSAGDAGLRVLPIVILYVGALLGEIDASEQTKEASIAVGLALLLPCVSRRGRARRELVDPSRVRGRRHDRRCCSSATAS